MYREGESYGGSQSGSAIDEGPGRRTCALRLDEWDAWRPDVMRNLSPYVLQDDAADEVRADQTSLFGQAEAHVRAVHVAMQGVPLSKTMISCAEIAMLPYDKTITDAKNELLVSKISTVLFIDKYRTHFHEYVYSYDHGAWSRTQSIPYVDLEFATISIRAAEGFFHTVHNRSPRPPCSVSDIAILLRTILSGKTVAELHAAHSGKIPGAYSWAQEAAKLCARMFKNFAEPGRDRVILSNYVKWASTPFPRAQNGVNFENCFYSIEASGDGEGEMRCGLEWKSPARNCYTSGPSRLDFRVSSASVARLVDSSRRLSTARMALSKCPFPIWRLLPAR